jgi:hypothetical protein
VRQREHRACDNRPVQRLLNFWSEGLRVLSLAIERVGRGRND